MTHDQMGEVAHLWEVLKTSLAFFILIAAVDYVFIRGDDNPQTKKPRRNSDEAQKDHRRSRHD